MLVQTLYPQNHASHNEPGSIFPQSPEGFDLRGMLGEMANQRVSITSRSILHHEITVDSVLKGVDEVN